MIIKKNNELKLAEKKVKYIQRGIEIEQIVGEEGIQWWNDFAEKWEHTSIIGFEDVQHTEQQVKRFEEVKNMKASESILQDYVVEGIIGEGLEILALKKENEELKQLMADLTETVLLGGGN